MTSRRKPEPTTGRNPRINLFRRKDYGPGAPANPQSEQEKGVEQHPQQELPRYNTNGQPVNAQGHAVTPHIEPDGESGRKWFDPLHFLRICFRSSCTASTYTNFLWPFTIAAMILHFAFPEKQLWIFITAYIGMVPAANLVGFGGQELARKIPKVVGVILETTFGSIVEIILFMVLIAGGNKNVPVIRAAILGSILANLLFCLGMNEANSTY